jgi:outer membrane receptor protein involved in Fe transport
MARISRKALIGGASMALSTLWCAQAALAADAGASAQGSNGTQLEEVQVTARRVKERLQDVPVTVAAISKADLQNNNAEDLAKVAELAPQVMIGRQNQGTGAIIAIRGISTSSADTGLDQSVSVALDGVQVSRGRIINTSVFDMQQVEVLEGPQALFFGKNSPAGVISLTSTNPGASLDGYIKGGYEFVAKERYVEAAVGGPLTDTLRARFAFRLSGMDGWIQNVAVPTPDPIHPGVVLPGNNFGGLQPADHNYAGRLTLLWTPTSDFDATLKVSPGISTSNSGSSYSETFCAPGVTQPALLGIPLTQSDCLKNRTKAESSDAPKFAVNYPYGNGGVPHYDSNYIFGSLTLNKRFSHVTLTSITGYYYQDYTQTIPADYTELTEIFDSQHEVYNLFTQELRAVSDFAGPVNFTAGLYYEHSKRTYFNAPDLLHAAFNETAQNYTTVEENANSYADSYSAFGQIRWKIIPSLELAAGARYTSDVKNLTATNLATTDVLFSFYPEGVPLHSHYTSDNFSPEVTLTWHPAEDQTLYGAYKTGYKPGGISNGSLLLSNATPENLQFGRERAEGGEIGYKALLLEHRLRVNLTGYYYNYDGLQVVSFQPQTISFTVGNAAAARTEGVEGSFEWLATRDLTFDGNIGYNHARYVSYPTAQCYAGQTMAEGCVGGVQDLSGKPLVRAPDVTFMLGADYKVHFPNGWIADISASGTYNSSYNAADDYSPGGYQSPFWLVNAALHVGPEDGKFDLAVIGRNLSDSYYLNSEFGWPLAATKDYLGVFNRPREVVFQIQYKF